MKQKTNNEFVVPRIRTKIRRRIKNYGSARKNNRFAFTGLVEVQKSIVNAIRNWNTLFKKNEVFRLV